MKKFSMLKALVALAVVYSAAVLITSVAQAGMIDSLMTAGMKTRETVQYKIDVYGYDARVYEFKPVNSPESTCVFIATGGNTNTATLQCW